MKYVIVLGDGMAGEPLEELQQKTTLEAARTPRMDALAPKSEQGIARMVPVGMAPGSDTANLAVAGYDPRKYYTGRSPLEALSIGVDMEPDDVAFRCNLVTLSEEDTEYENRTILDHKHCRGLDPSAHTTAGIVGLFLCKCTRSDTKAHIHKR